MRRKIYAANRSSVLYYLPWSDYIQQYESKAVSHAWETTYSKTKAIHDLQTCQSPDSQFADLLRALLTDDGLLFPRTRERLYTESNHSMRMFATGPFNYYYRAYGIESSEMSAVKRFLVFGKYEYNCRKAAFGETYPLISYEKVQQGIQTLLKEFAKGIYRTVTTPKIRVKLKPSWSDGSILPNFSGMTQTGFPPHHSNVNLDFLP